MLSRALGLCEADLPLVSGNVEPLATLPVPHPIGARFRDGYMYVTTTEGLTVYDVTKPELPVPVGALPLPHFENEDVDLGGNILLVSNDPSEGVGVLYVIDISNPRAPVLKSAMPNGFIYTGVPGIFGLPEPQEAGIGHTASCIKDCTVRLPRGHRRRHPDRRPARPCQPEEGRQVQARDHRHRHARRPGGLERAGLDRGRRRHGRLRRDRSRSSRRWSFGPTRTSGTPVSSASRGPTPSSVSADEGETPIDLIHHDSLRLSRPTSGGTFKPQAGKTYPLGGNANVVGVVEEDYNRPTCEGAGSFQTWGITNKLTSTRAKKMVLLDIFETELEALVNGRGWAPVTGLCSAHYFDERDRLVAGGWYEEGTRFLDVSDPTGIRQVGYWVPTKGETWSVLFAPTDPKGEIVYALDFARGIDVLRFDRSRPARAGAPGAQLAGCGSPARRHGDGAAPAPAAPARASPGAASSALSAACPPSRGRPPATQAAPAGHRRCRVPLRRPLRAGGEPHGKAGGETNADDEVVAESLQRQGAVVMGRQMFGGGEGPWGDEPWEGWWGTTRPSTCRSSWSPTTRASRFASRVGPRSRS